MNLCNQFFVKSLEENLATHRLVDHTKKIFQTLEEMVQPSNGEPPHIKPNTVSFGQADRLSCTVLCGNYTKTYRPQGIIFQTEIQPNYVAPFNLMALANVPGEYIIADYYRIVNELEEHYGRALIPGYESFLFKTPEEMIHTIPNPDVAWQMVNDFRKTNSLSPIPESERRLVEYNEAVFHNTINIEPVAIFGEARYVPRLTERAKSLTLPIYTSANEFFLEIQEYKREIERETLLKKM